MDILYDLIKSGLPNEFSNVDNILDWIKKIKIETYVHINETTLSSQKFWKNENGIIKNTNSSFFQIVGIKENYNGIEVEQPIIIQNEIGFLGIICTKIDGILKFCIQAKIEPGNVNCVQLSPTLQATKSNFTKKHGGKEPKFLNYFINAQKYTVLYDQIQSEQGSRFYKKRNRNMIIYVDEIFSLPKNFRWMTLYEIKQLLKLNNLINMDTRTVLSGLPFDIIDNNKINKYKKDFNFKNSSFINSIFYQDFLLEQQCIFQTLNKFKMFSFYTHQLIKLSELSQWKIDDSGIKCLKNAPYEIRYYDIKIEGREVSCWFQPLFKARSKAVFILYVYDDDGVLKILISIKHEIGTMDIVELGPTIQIDDIAKLDSLNNQIINESHVLCDVILSEEGGRFYHEENRNMIVKISKKVFDTIKNNYISISLATFYRMIKINNIFNIQLRNLITLIPFSID